RRRGTQAEDRFVERSNELRAVSVHQGLDEGAPDDIGLGIAREPVLELCASTWRIAKKDRAADRCGPEAVAASEQRGQRLSELLRLERAVLEERELPAVERFTELRVVVREREARQEVGREARAEGIQACRLPGGLSCGDREHRTDSVRSPVEALEQDRAGGNRRRGGEPNRRDRVGELARRIGWFGRPGFQSPPELEVAEP